MAIKALIGMAEADLTSFGGRPALHLIALAEIMRAAGAEVSVALDAAVVATPAGRAAVGLVGATCRDAEVMHFDSGRTFRGVSRNLVQAARFADFLQAQEPGRRWDWCITTGLGGLAYFAARSRLQGLALDSTRFAVGGFTLGQARVLDALAQFGSRLDIDTLVVEEAMGEAVDLVVTGPPLRFTGPPTLRLDEDSRFVLEQAELVYLVDSGDPALLRLVLEARDRVREGLGRDPRDLLLLADSPFASPSEDAEAMNADAAERNSTSAPPRTLVLGSHLLSTALNGLLVPVVARRDIVPEDELVRVCTGEEVARRLDGTATVGDFDGVVEAFPEALEREILRMLSGTAPVEEPKTGGDIPVIRGERPAQAEESWMEVLAAKQRSQPREG
nr:hypothetical protein [Actinomycetota bacterium]